MTAKLSGVSVVVPLFDEEENVAPLVAELEAALGVAALPWELILVDDGSRDASWQILESAGKRAARSCATRCWRMDVPSSTRVTTDSTWRGLVGFTR